MVWEITAEELLERYAAGERDFTEIILEYANLSGVELRNINLSGAQFSYVNLSGIQLRQCDLTAQFIYCNLTNAIIENCDLERARFYDCDLRGAILNHVELTATQFIRVNLEGTRTKGSGKDPCEFWDVTREDGVFVPGFTINLYMAESIKRNAERRKNGEDVF